MNSLDGDGRRACTTQGEMSMTHSGGEEKMEELRSESVSSKIFDDSFTKQQHSDFICWICRFQVNDPVTCCNGHLFCRDCVTRWIHPLSVVTTASHPHSNNNISNGGAFDLSSSSNQKPYCPTCRVTLKLEDLKPILGAADSQQFANGSSGSAKTNKRTSQRNVRVTRFSFLRDTYENEIEKLLSEIDDLEEQLDWCRHGTQLKCSRAVQTEEPFISDVQKARCNLENAVALAAKLKQDNERLEKEKEDWEMAKLNLTRELRLATENRNGGTPQKYGKFVISSLESKIENLEKENSDLKKVLERQDRYVKELEDRQKGPQHTSELRSSPSLSANPQDSSQILNLSNVTTAQSNHCSSLANMSLPSPFRKINLNSEKYDQSANGKVASEVIPNGTNEVSSSKESSLHKESSLQEVSASPSQTKRALKFSNKREDSRIEQPPSVNSEQKGVSRTKFEPEVEDMSRSRSRFEIESLKESSNCKPDDKTKSLTSKIPRPRSQSPAQTSMGVRRSPRKLANVESNANEKETVPKSAKTSSVPNISDVENQTKNAKSTKENNGTISSSMSKDLSAKLRLFGEKQGSIKKINELDKSFETEADQSSGSLSLGSSTKSRHAYDEMKSSDEAKLSSSTEHKETPVNEANTNHTVQNVHHLFEPIASQTESSPFLLDQANLSNESRFKQSSASFGSTEDLDLNEIFCNTQKRVESRAARKNCHINSIDSNTSQENINNPSCWKSSTIPAATSSSYLSSSTTVTNTGTIKGGIRPIVEFEKTPYVARNGNNLKLDLNLGSLNTFDSLLSPMSPLGLQKSAKTFVPNDGNSDQSSKSNSKYGGNVPKMTSPEFGVTLVSSDAGGMTSKNEESSSNLKYVKEIDETLAEITKLKGQSIQSLASVSSFSKQGPSVTGSGGDSPQKPDSSTFFSQSQFSTPQKSRSRDVSINLTPRSNSKRKFQEVNSNIG